MFQIRHLVLNEALIWNGSAWAPANAAVAIAPTVQFYAVDPAHFQPLEPRTVQALLVSFDQAPDLMFLRKDHSREIIAPVNLPHGATIQAITVFYEYTTLFGLLPLSSKLSQKALCRWER